MESIRILKALADETRVRLAVVLFHYELSVNELVNLLGMGQSRVSRHLKILAEAGLIQARRDGLWVFYSAVTQGPQRDFLASIIPYALAEGPAQADLALAAHSIEERTLKTRSFFNQIADDWDELNKEVLGDFHLPSAVQALVPQPCSKAVDLGCGTGEVLESLRQVCPEIIGVDGSSRMLELARRRFGESCSGVSLRIGELDHLPLRDGEASFASINLVLHHLSRPVEALQEAARVLQPDGLVCIADFEGHDLETMRTTYGDRWLGFKKEDVLAMLKTANLELLAYTAYPVNMGLSVFIALAQRS